MAYQATVYRVMIASPSDVKDERGIVREEIAAWNAAHSRASNIVLVPVGWETDTVPHLGDRPQAIINKQILKDADLLVAIFWTRLGTATGKDVSGTVEEIREHVATGKPTMVYFSAATAVDSVDGTQVEALKQFKNECKSWGLFTAYRDIHAFRALFARQLAQQLNNADRFPKPNVQHNASLAARPSIPVEHRLSAEAKILLFAAAGDAQGGFFWSHTHDGASLQTNAGHEIVKGSLTHRDEMRWKKACSELEQEDLIVADEDDYNFYSITSFGYEVADKLPKRA
jgi:hypothetical protein